MEHSSAFGSSTMSDEIVINNDIELPEGLVLRESMKWMSRARCKDADTSEFFVVRGDANKVQDSIKKYCAVCVVRVSCLNFAIDNNCKGLWGGVSEKNRRPKQRREQGIE